MRKLSTYLIRVIGIGFLLLLLIYIIFSIYIAVNKKDLLGKTTSTLSAKIGGRVIIEDMSVSLLNNFPFLSIKLKNISIRDSMFEKHHHEFFHADYVYLRINPAKLFIKKIALNKIELRNGSCYLFTDSSGYTNGYLTKGRTQSPKENDGVSGFDLSNVSVTNFLLTTSDDVKQKTFSFLIHQLLLSKSFSGYEILTKTKINSFTFNRQKGSFIKDRVLEGDFNINYREKAFSFKDIAIRIDKHPFILSGDFNFGETKVFSLHIQTTGLYYDTAQTLVTPGIAHGLRLVSVKNAPLDVIANISGSLSGGEPLIQAEWKTTGSASFGTPLLNFDSAVFSGRFINEVSKDKPRCDSNSIIELHRFSALWHGIRLVSDHISVVNLIHPVLTCNFKSDFKLIALNDLLGSSTLSLTSGTGKMDLSYKGAADHINSKNASFHGTIQFQDGSIQYHPFKTGLIECNGNINFDGANIIVNKLACKTTDKSSITMWGSAVNILAFLEDDPGKVKLDWNMYAPLFNLDGISGLFKRSPSAAKKSKANINQKMAATAKRVDNVLQSGDISVSLKADTIKYRRFRGEKVNAALTLKEKDWVLHYVSLAHAGGTISLDGKLETHSDTSQLTTRLLLKNIDAKNLLYSFNDFGQTGISYKNLGGNLSANLHLSVPISSKGEIDQKGMKGQIDFSLKNASLVDFAPVKKLQDFVFKGRDFSNIRFAEIKNKLEIENGFIKVNRMPVESSVLTLFVEGVYGLAGQTDLSIQVPLKNLSKRDSSYTLAKPAKNSGGGLSIFLRASSDKDGKLRLRYDPLGRLRNSNKDIHKEKKP